MYSIRACAVAGRTVIAFICGCIAIADGALAAPDKASLRLEWDLTGYQLPFFWAKEKGYYRDEGIDLDILEGGGSNKTINLIVGKQDTFGFADYALVGNAVSKGMPVKAVYSTLRTAGWAVVSWGDAPLRSPQDLIGKTVVSSADHKPLLSIVLAANGIFPDLVTVQVVSGPVRNTIFKNGGVDGMVSTVLGSPNDLVVDALRGNGKPVHFMEFSDFGMVHLGIGVFVHDDLVQSNPDLIRRFLRATDRAVADCIQPVNYDEATDIALRASPRAAGRRDSVKQQWIVTVPRLTHGDNAGHSRGSMNDKDWKTIVDILTKSGQIGDITEPGRFYTNRFVPGQ
jgi:NitT/TauT family transport system substrate-binding protein